MIAEDVKQVRCTTCDADHEYKHAKVPRQRRKTETPAALYSQVLTGGPRPVLHETATSAAADPDAAVVGHDEEPTGESAPAPLGAAPEPDERIDVPEDEGEADEARVDEEDGPVHRPLIRASLPRTEGQAPPQRPATDFTIRQPGGRPNRFRPR